MGEVDILDKLVVASLSDVGRSRSENQDSFREATNALGERLLVIADGMGGHRGGAEASRMCVQTLERRFLEQHDSVEVRLRRGIDEANADILRRGLEDSDLGGMGATCVALVLCPDAQAWIAWAGDSRIYRLRGDKLEQLSEDHSLVAEWQKLGVLTPAQAAHHPKRNELTRAIGVTREVDPDLRALELRPGDRFLLCSDGLTGVVDDPTLAELLGSREPTAAARALVDLANARGGPDNVTVQIAWLPDPSAPEKCEASKSLAPDDPWADFDFGDSGPPTPTAGMPEAQPESVSQTRQDNFDLPPRAGGQTPNPAAVKWESAARSAPKPAEAPVEPRPAPRREGGRPRVIAIERGGLHPPSLIAGLIGGIALALVAGAYLQWQRSEPALPPVPVPVAMPRAAEPPAPAPAVEPAPAAAPEPVAVPAPPPAAPPARPPKPERAAPPPPDEPASPVQLVPAPQPTPTSEAFELPEALHRFLDRWLAALAQDDAEANAALGFPISPREFLRTEASREGYRLIQAELSPRTTARQTFLRVVVSYAFTNGSGRFRTEDELRLILEEGAGGLHFAGYWQE